MCSVGTLLWDGTCAPSHEKPHLIHGSLDPQQSATQMKSRSFQPSLHGSSLCPRHTDHATCDMCSNRPHLLHCVQLTQPKNSKPTHLSTLSVRHCGQGSSLLWTPALLVQRTSSGEEGNRLVYASVCVTFRVKKGLSKIEQVVGYFYSMPLYTV